MTALAYPLLHPGSVRSHISVSTAPQAQPFAIAIRSLQREGDTPDPNWDQGHYDDARYSEAGMSIARAGRDHLPLVAMEWVGRFARIRLDHDQPARRRSLRRRIRWSPTWSARAQVRPQLRSKLLPVPNRAPAIRSDAAEYGGGYVDAARWRRRGARPGDRRSTDILFPLSQQEQISPTVCVQGREVTSCPRTASRVGAMMPPVDIERFGAPSVPSPVPAAERPTAAQKPTRRRRCQDCRHLPPRPRRHACCRRFSLVRAARVEVPGQGHLPRPSDRNH